MRHKYFGRKFSRTKNERRRLFQGLVRDLFKLGKIKTTLAKAKAVQGLVDSLVTSAKLSGSQGKIQVGKVLSDDKLEEKLVQDAKTRFSKRSSGYTRIIKLGVRTGDAAEEVILSFVDASQDIVPLAAKNNKTEIKPEKKEIKKAVKKSAPKTAGKNK